MRIPREAWLAACLLAAGCVSDSPPAEPVGTASTGEPAPAPVPKEPPGDEDEILADLERWRNGLLAGNFDAYYDGCSYYYRAQWLFRLLGGAGPKAGAGVPRAGELDDEQLLMVQQWYERQVRRARQSRELEAARLPSQMEDLPVPLLRSTWLPNVLRDDFQKQHANESLYMRNARFSLKTSTATNAMFLVAMPDISPWALQMVREEERWRVRYAIPSGRR
jgi:hypothetical protein